MLEEQPEPVANRPFLQRAWNAWTGRYIPVREGRIEINSTHERHRDAVLRLLMSLDLQNPEILDVGCANGWLSAELARFGRVTGIDVSNEAIAKAKTIFPNLEFIEGDFLNFDLPFRRFDVAVSCKVICVVDNQREFANRLAFVLKQGGWLILLCPNKFVWDRMEYIKTLPDEIPDGRLYRRDLEKLLSECFTVAHCETVIPEGRHGILRIVNSYKLNDALRLLIDPKWISAFKERLGLGKSLVVLARKK
jgi:SAM-dependent methyltransferase